MTLTKDEIIQRGLAAASLLQNGSYKAALVAMEAHLAEAWKASNPTDTDGRERLYLMVQLMADIGRILAIWKSEADFAAAKTAESQQPVPTLA